LEEGYLNFENIGEDNKGEINNFVDKMVLRFKNK
jgi:hypothetical protein